jgi:hypothetical protein
MIRLGLLSLLAFLLLVGCGQSEVGLPYGYSYVQLDGVNGTIVDSQHVVVIEPNVMRYQVIGRYIVGERNNPELDPRISRKYGYFVFDMLSRDYVGGLSKSDFETALRRRRLGQNPFS